LTVLQVKIKALKQTIMLLLSGESLPRVLMSVIRFCSNTDDHALKKLLMLYWEVSCTYRSMQIGVGLGQAVALS
jgi:coatomer subunit beta